MKEHRISKLINKRGYSTEGSTLLPSVLRPRLFGIGAAIGAVAFIGTALNVNNNQASAVVQATLTIPDSISADVNPMANNGFAEGTPGQVEVSTNNQAGYTLSIKAKDGTELKNGSNTLQSITTNLTADQYKNSEYYNTLGFKPDVLDSLANTNYIPSPSTSGIVLAKANTNSLLPETFNLAIATKVSQDAVAGNYSNSFVLTATGNEAQYNIAFDVGEGSGGPEEVQHGYIGDDLEVQINSTIPTLEGKDFLGWCTKKPKEDGSCTGVIVQPAGCFPLCKCDLNITLYAMYGEKSGTSGGGGGADFWGLSNGTACEYRGQQGKVYAGMCWMSKNLNTKRNWQQANADCAAVGWRLPSYSDFTALIDGSIGADTGNKLYSESGWNGDYWSSTLYGNGGYAYYLSVDSSRAYVTNADDNFSRTRLVRCVAG